jgi:two-component system sensor histidine kinase MprB
VSLRWKIALAMAAIVTVATVAIGAATYRSTRDRLFIEIDRSLSGLDAAAAGRRGIDPNQPPVRGPLSNIDVQVVDQSGAVIASTFPEPIPVSAADLAVLGPRRPELLSTVSTPEGDVRLRTVRTPQGALQLGRSLEETYRVLDSLRTRIVLWVLIVAALSTAAGWWIASRVTASLRRLTAAAVEVEATGRLDVAVGEQGDDEVGTLGAAFDRMLIALARSNEDQRRLVQDAGHELRTPLTSLRTNLDTLRRFPNMSAVDRDAIVDDLHAETTELTDLVNEVVALASGDASDEEREPFDLAVLVTEVAERYERRSARAVVVSGSPSPVIGQRASIQRAISCLLDNARKFDQSGGPIEVSVADGEVRVCDRGPGIPSGELDLVFERFHRSDEARTLPGSGLGLSIVREVARRHGGDATARHRDGGGAEIIFRLPTAADDGVR